LIQTSSSPGSLIILRYLLLIFGVICISTAVILLKASTEHPLLVASYRLLIAALGLLPFYLKDLAKYEGEYGLKQISWSLLPAVLLAAHFSTWVIGARMTQVANASLIINLTPVAMPFFVWILFREQISRREIIGTLFTLGGVGLLTGQNLRVDPASFRGDLVCLASMLGFAAYLALGRRNGARLGLWLYTVPLYGLAGMICLLSSFFFLNPIKSYSLPNILYIVALGVIPTILGHSILNASLRYFRGQVVSVTNVASPIFAGFFGYLAFGEAPGGLFYPAAALILVGIIIVLTQRREK
jgi:drug/metabolite transporter (DMT)-like permease